MFRLTQVELSNWRSQIVTSGWGGTCYAPRAFSEHGILMLSNVLNSERAVLVKVNRYEIYDADLNPTIGGELRKIRPVVVVSKSEMNRYLNTVVVCPITRKLHPKWRSRVQTKCVQKRVEVAVDQIRTISKKRLKDKIDDLSSKDAVKLRSLITEMYGE